LILTFSPSCVCPLTCAIHHLCKAFDYSLLVSQMSRMNHNFIPNNDFPFQKPYELIHGFEVAMLIVGCHPPLAWCLQNVIVCPRSPFTNFSSCFSIKLAKQLKVDFPIGFDGHVGMLLVPLKMLHLPHSNRTIYQSRTFYQSWNTTFVNRRMFLHSFVDLMFSISLNVSSNFYKRCRNIHEISKCISMEHQDDLKIFHKIPCIP
jgi:hypothetical protein